MNFLQRVSNFWNGLPPLGKAAVGIGTTLVVYKGVKYVRQRAGVNFVPLPNSGSGIPVVGYDPQGQAVSWSPKGLVDLQFSVMSGGGTLSGTKDAAWQKLIDLPTSDMLAATYNAFNADPRSEGDSLTTWIDDELYYDYFSGVKDEVLAKLRAGGLT